MKLSAHWIKEIDEHSSTNTGKNLCSVHEASQESVCLVLAGDPRQEDTRSQFMWIRLSNGDLILGVFPQGETYFAVADDAMQPEELRNH